MKRIHIMLLLLLQCVAAGSASAHAVWLETTATGVKGKAQLVKVFYGEYEEGELEKTNDWYADLAQLELQLIQPDQSTVKVPLKDMGTHLEGFFTPQETGTYLLFTQHIARDLYEKSRYQFNAFVGVQVGTKVNTLAPLDIYGLQITGSSAVKEGQELHVSLLKNTYPCANQEVTIMAPDGWVKKMQTDAEGNLSFTAKNKGTYVLEYSRRVEATGLWGDKPFDETWHTVSASIAIR
ncbi:DUF4198 domain-containing protein [Sphingobacterium sp. Mn56C]|uniref:DUF4198 domain-containing protein n=1 Tax=Sphingobacterium sp. Mn56C TaxID=3395261 RepID=UPI003BE65B7A